MKTSQPVVTVITVVYNAGPTIEETILSVLEQTYPNIEYIVVDGGSTDETIAIIKKYDGRITRWISESDNGIYDAMNKGVGLASGDYINFLNCGDTFLSRDSIAEVVSVMPPNADLVYGHTYYKNGEKISLHETYDLHDLWKSMIFCHQSLFARTGLLKEMPFDTTYKISSDFGFVYRCYSKGCVFFDTKKIIATHCTDGISEQRIIKRMMERWSIVNRLTPSVAYNWFYLKLFFRKLSCVLRKAEW